jgi:hypothetical protein
MKRFSNHLIICFLGCVHIVYAQSGQLAVPRVNMMPNQPTPYNVRDWKQVAMRYDSFVYDVQKTGQYLPLTFINPAGVNYPQRPSFRMHTYVGTNSPFGNEAINVLPSLVGASLVGIDKSNQFRQELGADGAGFFTIKTMVKISISTRLPLPAAMTGGTT